MISRKPNRKLMAADAAVRANPTLASMRATAYAPVQIPDTPRNTTALIAKAEDKRAARRAKRLKNL